VVDERPLIRHRESVALVVLEGKRVVLVRQTRPGAGRTTLELPQETFEPGETALLAARRGLAEECGLTAEEWTEHGTFWAVPAYSTERVHVLSARCKGTVSQRLDPDEDIVVEHADPETLPGSLDDAISIAAWTLWSRGTG
jgi:ADP-ribose pyrophosphatase